jgi:hypothetical protein
MLHKETVSPATLELIKVLQADPYFHDFLLAGGTGLSLQIGHRISVDIDLFTRNSFNEQEYLEHLEKNYNFSLQYMHSNTLKGFINGIFVDLLQHDYKCIKPAVEAEGMSLFSKADIAAMKINVISGNGTRVKDFVDIYFLLKEFSFEEIVSFYTDKYNNRNEFHAIKSLTYYEDIDETGWINLVKEKGLTMAKVKKSINRHRDEFINRKTGLGDWDIGK